MNLLLNTYRPEGRDGCEYAFLEMDASLAKLILARKQAYDALRKEDIRIATIEYHSGDMVFLLNLPEEGPRDYFADLETEDFIEVTLSYSDIASMGLVERTECEYMVIGQDDVYWSCIPKHCDWHVETRPINYDTFREALV